MVFAVTGTGVPSVTSCQPDDDSPVKVAVASSVPAVDQRCPTCVPVFASLR